jgi:S1-C subfamily serine protease
MIKKLTAFALGLFLFVAGAYASGSTDTVKDVPTTAEESNSKVDESTGMIHFIIPVYEEILEEPETTLEDALKSAVRLEILREVRHVDYITNKKTKKVEEVVTYEQIPILCSGNYISDNHILTNKHCVENQLRINILSQEEVEKRAEIEAELDDLDAFESTNTTKGELIYKSTSSDLALIWVPKANPHHLKLSSANPTLGDTVYTYGQPLGIPFVLTRGIVAKIHPNKQYLLTDLTVIPGNSGGALLDENGRLVGVCNALYSMNPFFIVPSGLTVAVSAEAVQEFLDKVRIN